MRYQEEGVFMEALIWGKRVSRVENGRFSYVDFVSLSEIQSNFALQIAFAHNIMRKTRFARWKWLFLVCRPRFL